MSVHVHTHSQLGSKGCCKVWNITGIQSVLKSIKQHCICPAVFSKAKPKTWITNYALDSAQCATVQPPAHRETCIPPLLPIWSRLSQYMQSGFSSCQQYLQLSEQKPVLESCFGGWFCGFFKNFNFLPILSLATGGGGRKRMRSLSNIFCKCCCLILSHHPLPQLREQCGFGTSFLTWWQAQLLSAPVFPENIAC